MRYATSYGEAYIVFNILNKFDERISSLNNEEYSYLVLNTKKSFIQATLCREENTKKYYQIEYNANRDKISNILSKSEECHNKSITISLFNKFYKGDINYQTDIKWKNQELHFK